MTRRIVVAGGAGFLGSHICDALIERGDAVVCVDDLSTGRTTNIAHLAGNERFQFIEHDIVVGGLDARLAGLDIHGVMNLASPASPPDYLRRPIATLEAGSVGTRHLLAMASKYGAKFFLASTSEVYGDPLVNPQPESYWGNVNPVGPRSVYDEAKRFAEALTLAVHRETALPVSVARIFNTYGPRMQPDDGRVVTNFVNQALAGEPITIYGDGTQTRSFCYVDDEVAGLVALFESDLVGPVNIGSTSEFTMLELAELVLDLTDSSSVIEFRALPTDDPKVRRPDITLARSRLGWEPSVMLRDGLRRTIDWCRANR